MLEVRNIPTQEMWSDVHSRILKKHPSSYENNGLAKMPLRLIRLQEIEQDGITVETLSEQGFYPENTYAELRDGIQNALDVVEKYWDVEYYLLFENEVQEARHTYRVLTVE